MPFFCVLQSSAARTIKKLAFSAFAFHFACCFLRIAFSDSCLQAILLFYKRNTQEAGPVTLRRRGRGDEGWNSSHPLEGGLKGGGGGGRKGGGGGRVEGFRGP